MNGENAFRWCALALACWLVGASAAKASEASLVGFAGGGNGVYSVKVKSLQQVRFATTVHQQMDWSCGSAAVATLLTYNYGHPVTEHEVLRAMFVHGNRAKIRREGFSLLDIKRFLESIGYEANGFETSLDKLAQARVPAIVMISDNGYNHFVVVKGIRNGNVLVGDPARGARVIPRDEFQKLWRNRIVFVVTNKRDKASFNDAADWRYMAAPLGEAVSRESLGSMLLFRPGPNDF